MFSIPNQRPQFLVECEPKEAVPLIHEVLPKGIDELGLVRN
jgi:hypothetical protein